VILLLVLKILDDDDDDDDSDDNCVVSSAVLSASMPSLWARPQVATVAYRVGGCLGFSNSSPPPEIPKF
jgi:hypothetical protein